MNTVKISDSDIGGVVAVDPKYPLQRTLDVETGDGRVLWIVMVERMLKQAEPVPAIMLQAERKQLLEPRYALQVKSSPFPGRRRKVRLREENGTTGHCVSLWVGAWKRG